LGWCCMQGITVCPVSRATESHDCQIDFVDCRNAWSKDRQHWCLIHEGVRCRTESSVPQVSGKSGSDGFVTFADPDATGSDEPFETPTYDAGGGADLAASPHDGALSGVTGNASYGYVSPVGSNAADAGSNAAYGDPLSGAGVTMTTDASGWPGVQGNDDFAGFVAPNQNQTPVTVTTRTTLAAYVFVPAPSPSTTEVPAKSGDVRAGSKELSDAAAETSTADRATGATEDRDVIASEGLDFRATKEIDTITASEGLSPKRSEAEDDTLEVGVAEEA